MRQVRESGLSDQCLCQLVDAARRHPDLRPVARPQNGVTGIARAFHGPRPCPVGNYRPCLRLHVQFKTDEFLISSVAEHQGHKRHVEHTLFPCHTHRLTYLRQCRQRLVADLLIAAHLVGTHIDKLGILDAHGIDRVGIAGPQRLLPGIYRQHTVDPDLPGSQVHEPLSLSTQAEGQESTNGHQSQGASHVQHQTFNTITFSALALL